VLACVVLKSGVVVPQSADDVLVGELFAHCDASLAYYKAPGWLWFTDEIPTTGTQKVQKHQLFAADSDPRVAAGMMDLRSWKKRQRTS
jgi:crotonobetaine/carnitine-CoA ligase